LTELALRLKTIFSLLLVCATVSGCAFRTHAVKTRYSSATLEQATQPQLVARINTAAEQIKSLNATVDIATSVGGAKKGKVTDFEEIRGYVLLRKPRMLRMIGLFPVVRNRAFDMTSNGAKFSLSVPPKGKFFVGSQEVKCPSKNALENLRPQVILDALLVKEIDPANEVAVIENGAETVKDPNSKKDVLQPNYVLDVIRHDSNGAWYMARKIYFDRTDLTIERQEIFDRAGNIATIAKYANFTDVSGIQFPSIIFIDRPQEEYTIQLSMVPPVKLNVPLRDEQFDLQQPPGSQFVNLDTTCSPATAQ